MTAFFRPFAPSEIYVFIIQRGRPFVLLLPYPSPTQKTETLFKTDICTKLILYRLSYLFHNSFSLYSWCVHLYEKYGIETLIRIPWRDLFQMNHTPDCDIVTQVKWAINMFKFFYHFVFTTNFVYELLMLVLLIVLF